MGSSDLSGGIVRSGSIDSAENMSVAVLMVCRIDLAMSQVQFVDGVSSFNAGEGRRIGDTRGSTRKVTRGAQ
jgi:hypothetical protein